MFNYTKNFKSRWREMVNFNDIEWLNQRANSLLWHSFSFEEIKDQLDEYLFLGAEVNRAFADAAAFGLTEVVDYLIDKGAYIHYADNSACRWAAFNDRLGTVELLINRGVDHHKIEKWLLANLPKRRTPTKVIDYLARKRT